MDISSGYLEKIRESNKIGKIYTREQDLAEQIFSYFKAYPLPIKFGYIMTAIKIKGYQYVAEQFADIKQSTLQNPPAIFMYRMKHTKIEMREI